jgi:hypothetical protein
MFKAILSGLIITIGASGGAMANTLACGDRGDIVGHLTNKYQESHQASGLQSESKMIELWTSSATGSWTILVTEPTGKTCIAAAGQSWLDMKSEAPVSGKAS